MNISRNTGECCERNERCKRNWMIWRSSLASKTTLILPFSYQNFEDFLVFISDFGSMLDVNRQLLTKRLSLNHGGRIACLCWF